MNDQSLLENAIKRFRQISFYNPKTQMLNEGFGDVDTSNYICIGEIPYYPWGGGSDENHNKVYIMVSPQKQMKWGKEQYDVRYTANSDGSGLQTDSLPSYHLSKFVIYPEHQNDEYGEIFMGQRKDTNITDQQHKEFVSKLFRTGNGQIILHHNSSMKITDGLIKKGQPNHYSSNTDVGIYFWGSRNSGNDPSSGSTYTYYCLIDENDLYDLSTDTERLITLRRALSKYKYAGQYWANGDAICVNTFESTPIWCILDNHNGKWYDKDWNEIEKPF